MVEAKSRKRFYFLVFIIPSFFLYSLFFIYPFLNGLYISLTNWDGLTPRAPISMDAAQFESKILYKLKKESDKQYLLSVYEKNAADSTYSRLSLTGSERRKVESVIGKTGYEPDRYRFVGLKNYLDIISGKVSDAFYPRSYDQSYFNISSAIPQRIEKKNFAKNFLSKIDESARTLFGRYYDDQGDFYVLKAEYSEFGYEDKIWLIPEFEMDQKISADSVSSFIAAVKKSAVEQNTAVLESSLTSFISEHSLSDASANNVRQGAEGLYALGELKVLFAEKWNSKGFDLGVVGFTIFFAFFSVIGINLLAFALALALDTGIRGQKVLRSIFFLPNVLSMVIVALIWKMLFFQMFPRITGIDQWLSDPAKTPWLIVLVAVWQGAGYYMIVYLAGLQNIPTDVVEAAKIDGASPWQRFVHITMPLLVPALTISFFLTIANALKSFDLIYAMTSGSAYTYGTVPLVLDIYFDAFARKQAGLATAKAMLLFFVIFIITGLQLYVMKKKEVEQ